MCSPIKALTQNVRPTVLERRKILVIKYETKKEMSVKKSSIR